MQALWKNFGKVRKKKRMKNMDLNTLSTERRNPKTTNLDCLSIKGLLEIMNEEDSKVPLAVKEVLPEIEKAIEAVSNALKNGGRLIYTGAGTSGRLGILDAVECMPTFGTSYEVEGLIAGGEKAFVKAQEGIEDSREEGQKGLMEIGLSAKDVVVGIAASGRTPYVIGALKFAREIGAKAVSIACNKNSKIKDFADIAIEVDVGPEILTGSTRLKAGTAQKMILNMISTISMVQYGKVFGNLMVDLKATNLKLVERSKRIIMMATDCDYEMASKMYEASERQPKAAIVMILTGVSKEEAVKKLEKSEGFIRKAIGEDEQCSESL
jgi:N-acetylmuramic acid 6-phosphate etherase